MIKKSVLTMSLIVAMAQTACAENQPEETAAEQQDHIIETVKTVAAPAPKKLPVYNAPDSDWRDLDPENTLVIETVHGQFVIELYPEIAPLHVERIKTLTRNGFYDNIAFHRVIQGFMNQTGDPLGNGTGNSTLPDLQAEFTFKRSPEDIPINVMGDVKSKTGSATFNTGFYKALPIASKPDGAAFATKTGKVDAYPLHCKGITSMARGGHDINSANSQFFLMRAAEPNLDADYSIWGSTVYGREHLTKIKVGTIGETKNFVPERMLKVRIASDLPPAEKIAVQVLDTQSPSFINFKNEQRKLTGRAPRVCDIDIPSRLKP
ncbi:MAG: peptidylprolyl isomerase [Hellea sp.]|nr:peptidylprolyl isomerase [Hellea sp.]